MKEEYLMMRDEILNLNTLVNNTINLVYTFIAAYLAIIIKQNDTIYIILAYVVIIPAYLVVLSKIQGQCKIGAYLYVYEKKLAHNFHWETYNKIFREQNPNIFSHLLSGNAPFLFISICILLLHIYKIDWSQPVPQIEILKLGINIILFSFVMFIIYKNRNLTTADYISKWERIIS